MPRLVLACGILLAMPAVAEAGMPAIGPMLTRFAQTRLQGISFFALCVVLAAACVRWLQHRGPEADAAAAPESAP